jgi:hypothetical protein
VVQDLLAEAEVVITQLALAQVAQAMAVQAEQASQHRVRQPVVVVLVS